MVRREKGRCPRPRDPPPVPALKTWEGNDVLDARPILRCEEKGYWGERLGKGKRRDKREEGKGRRSAGEEETVSG